jgi:hypothetical protein
VGPLLVTVSLYLRAKQKLLRMTRQNGRGRGHAEVMQKLGPHGTKTVTVP